MIVFETIHSNIRDIYLTNGYVHATLINSHQLDSEVVFERQLQKFIKHLISQNISANIAPAHLINDIISKTIGRNNISR
ncbi:MAG: hypothetical protein KKB34_12965 [Bacteroidetes bacterium]|nr:hypothetical protein [Bacteroidota bacterium]